MGIRELVGPSRLPGSPGCRGTELALLRARIPPPLLAPGPSPHQEQSGELHQPACRWSDPWFSESRDSQPQPPTSRYTGAAVAAHSQVINSRRRPAQLSEETCVPAVDTVPLGVWQCL